MNSLDIKSCASYFKAPYLFRVKGLPLLPLRSEFRINIEVVKANLEVMSLSLQEKISKFSSKKLLIL